jgi:hypothetical protein
MAQEEKLLSSPLHPWRGDRAVTPGLVCCKRLNLQVIVAGSTGLEPAASGVTGRRSNQLNYDPNIDWAVQDSNL